MVLNILGTEFSLSNKSFEIYLSGCKAPHCKNCHNPESWDFNAGREINFELIKKIKIKIKEFDSLIDNIWVLGGEPLDQTTDDLLWLINHLNKTNKKIWLWTGYDISKANQHIKESVDYIKCGKYIDNESKYLTKYGFWLASSNQKIYKM